MHLRDSNRVFFGKLPDNVNYCAIQRSPKSKIMIWCVDLISVQKILFGNMWFDFDLISIDVIWFVIWLCITSAIVGKLAYIFEMIFFELNVFY